MMATPNPSSDSPGDKGGVPGVPGVRSAIQYLKRQLADSDVLMDDELAKSIRFAVNVRDDPNMGPRERLRASELLESIRARGIDLAKYIDERDRVDKGGATERVEVVFVDRLPKAGEQPADAED